MGEAERRRFSREFKLAALSRMDAGENVSALARELGVRRKCLYQWRERFRLGGPIALRSRGRPSKAEALAIQTGPRTGLPEPLEALAVALWRINELERKIGQQQADLDFLQRVLRQTK